MGKLLLDGPRFQVIHPFEESPLVYDKTISICDSPGLLSTAPKDIIICHPEGSVVDQQLSNVSCNIFKCYRCYIYILIYSRKSQSIPNFVSLVVIGLKDASTLMEYVESNNKPTASMRFNQTFGDRKPAPVVVASYASRGPSLSYSSILKPDVMAPGSMILAAIPHPFLHGEFEFVSGTSFACALASGD